MTEAESFLILQGQCSLFATPTELVRATHEQGAPGYLATRVGSSWFTTDLESMRLQLEVLEGRTIPRPAVAANALGGLMDAFLTGLQDSTAPDMDH